MSLLNILQVNTICNFQLVPNLGMDLIEMDVDDSKIKTKQNLDPTESKSKLPLPIREAIGLFFDVDLMKQQLAEFEVLIALIYLTFSIFQLDTEKMPLGKMSRRQIL